MTAIRNRKGRIVYVAIGSHTYTRSGSPLNGAPRLSGWDLGRVQAFVARDGMSR